MPIYTVTRTGTALSTADDLLTICSSAKPLRIMIADFGGLGVSSSANELVMMRGTTAGSSTPGGGITPTPVNSGSAAAAFTAYTTWGVQPSTAGAVLWRFGVNGNGGQNKFMALPGAEISVPSSGYVSFRSVLGTGTVVSNLMIEELDG